MRRYWKIMLVLLLGAGLVLGGFPFVYAEEEEEEKTEEKEVFTLETITVTATKREESVLEVPVAISAFSDVMMEKLGITNTDDLEAMTPGLQFGTASGQGTTIRGIGSRLWGSSHADQSVAYYVDGVYSYTLNGVAPDMFDMARVEVARGPQGTVNGRNSIAGSISFFPKRPSDQFEMDALVEITNQVTQRYNLAFGGPLPFFGRDWLSYRITAGAETGDGAFHNIGHGPDAGKPDEKFIFPQIRFKTDRIDINVRYTESEDHGVPWPTNMRMTRIPPDQYFYSKNPVPPIPFESSIWYLDMEPLPVTSLCPDVMPNQCDELQLMINTNADTFTDAMRTSLTIHAEFDITQTLAMVYTHGQSRSESFAASDSDGSNATGGWEGDLWWVNRHGNFRDDGRTLNSETGSILRDIRVRGGYSVKQSSHELTFRSDFDGPFNFLAGIFYYQNETGTRSATDNYTGNIRFNNNAERWDQLRLAQYPPQRWGNFPLYEQYMAETHGWDPDTAQYGVDGGRGIAPGTEEECNMYAYYGALQFWGPSAHHPNFELYCDYRTDRLEAASYANVAATETKAGFLHGDYQFGNLTLSGGARYTTDVKRQELNGWTYLADFANVIVYGAEETASEKKPSWGQWIWDVSLEYTPEGNTMYYGRVSTGYRAGGFSTFVTEYGFEPPEIGEETLINYEIGVKSQSMDQRLTLTSSLFLSQYDDMQITLAQNYPAGAYISPQSRNPLITYTANIPTSDLYGFEGEFAYYPTERWRLSGYYMYFSSSLGSHQSVTRGHPDPEIKYREYLILVGTTYNVNADEPAFAFSHWGDDGKAVPLYDDDTGEPIPCNTDAGVCYSSAAYQAMDDKTGNEMPKQPNHKFALTASYTHPLQFSSRDLGSLTLLSSYIHTGIRHPYIANLGYQEMRAYNRWDARATWEWGNGSVALWVQNIMDDVALKEYIPDATSMLTPMGHPGADAGMLSDGRRIGLVLRWKI